MSIADKIKSLFSGRSKYETPEPHQTEPARRGPTPDEIAAAAAATPEVTRVEPISAEGDAVVQPAGVPEYDGVEGHEDGGR